jgi:hypothetical protein
MTEAEQITLVDVCIALVCKNKYLRWKELVDPLERIIKYVIRVSP